MEELAGSQIRIQRPLYEHHQLREDLFYEKPKKSHLPNLCQGKIKVSKIIRKIIPAVKWVADYKWKRDIISDLISGFTVAVMHIPQGMAYALLGNVPPVVGIYMAFFPVLVYFFLGTSRHNSMGTFAVVCLMTGKTVLEHSDPTYFKSAEFELPANDSINNPRIESLNTGYSPVEVATSVTFIVAIVQLIMFLLHMGVVSALLSETLVSGFTTGAAIHVLVSQIKDLLGLTIPRFKGKFSNIYTVNAIFDQITYTNPAAVIISAITIFVMVINNELLKPLISKKSRVPIPIELIAVVVGTLTSKYCFLEETYKIKVVGEIPVGLPEPRLPQFALMPSIILDGVTIAIVSYTITLSMGLIFAQKLNYEVDANQELLAMGTGNLFGSFFSCMPFCASLSRSLIQQVVGGKTQLASIVSCSILVMVLLWVGPFFETLPKSVLASIIVVALKGMLIQTMAVFQFWKLSKMDALVWTATFLTVVFIGIDIGLLVGVLTSLVTIFVLGFKPYTCLLGSVEGTDLYLDTNRYKGAREIDGIKIFSYSGGINFATKNIFKSQLINLTGINPQKEIIYRSKIAKHHNIGEKNLVQNITVTGKIEKYQNKINTETRCIILDFSSVSYVDPSGVSMLRSVVDSFQKLNIPIYIATCSDPIYEMLKKCELIYEIKSTVRIFPSVHDAVHSARDLFQSSLNSSILTVAL